MSKLMLLLALVAVASLVACKEGNKKLPVLGEPTITQNSQTGKPDTMYPTIPPFYVTNQDSNTLTIDSFNGKLYVADFIFLSCPSICPVMNKQMKRVYDAYVSNEKVCFISHTIDPENDTIPRLKQYALKLGVKAPKWNFVTAPADTIYSLAEKYYATVFPDDSVPGGFTHSGGFLLIDSRKHIRGAYEGTDSVEVEKLIKDIELLLTE